MIYDGRGSGGWEWWAGGCGVAEYLQYQALEYIISTGSVSKVLHQSITKVIPKYYHNGVSYVTILKSYISYFWQI